jgi:uncharacterized protein (DUF58 family)
MAHKQTNTEQKETWLWLPLIVGLIIGVTLAAMTGLWWWSTVGVLVGAAVGWLDTGRPRKSDRSGSDR